MHFWSIHFVSSHVFRIFKLSCFFDHPKSGPKRENRAILVPILRFGPSKFPKGPFRSKKWAPQRPIPEFWREPTGPEIASHPVPLPGIFSLQRRRRPAAQRRGTSGKVRMFTRDCDAVKEFTTSKSPKKDQACAQYRELRPSLNVVQSGSKAERSGGAPGFDEMDLFLTKRMEEWDGLSEWKLRKDVHSHTQGVISTESTNVLPFK